MRTFTSLLLLFLFTASLFPQIVKQFEERSFDLKDVKFTGNDTAYACGAPYWDQASKSYIGTIIKTCNGGDTWQTQNVPVAESFNKIFFLDKQTAWAAGENGTMVKTTDGGETWSSLNTGTTGEIRGLYFTDASNGWISAMSAIFDSDGEFDTWEAHVWHTNNGGTSWTEQFIPDSISILNDICFFNEDTGIIVGVKEVVENDFLISERRGVILKTTDGGDTWKEQYRFLPVSELEPEYIPTAVKFVDSLHGWVVGFTGNSLVEPGNIYYTTDGGDSWTKQDSTSSCLDVLWDIDFKDSLHGYAVGLSSQIVPLILRTIDGGNTWEDFTMYTTQSELLYGISLSGDKILAVGSNDLIVKTDTAWGNCGQYHCDFLEMDYINTHYRFEDIFFTDEQHGWAVGHKNYKYTQYGPVIFKTNNGGSKWYIQYQSSPDTNLSLSHCYELRKVYFIDSLKGWVIGSSQREIDKYTAIMYTENGGKNWTEMGTGLYDSKDIGFWSVDFTSETNGWALARRGDESLNGVQLAHTTNGGTDWNLVNTELYESIGPTRADVCFYDSLHGWITGGLGVVMHTSDGGQAWVNQSLSRPLRFYRVTFISPTKGWIAGEGLFATEDGGNTWNETGVEGELQDIEFVNSSVGWIVGDYGKILCTSNGGETWMEVNNSSIASSLLGLSFINDSTGWAAGDYGRIIKISINKSLYTGMQNVTILNKKDQDRFAHSDFNLTHYPQPCTDKLYIKFLLDNPSKVKLSIVELTGRMIYEGPAEKFNTGEQIIELNTNPLAKGIYIYALQIGNQRIYRKFLKE